MKSFIFLLVLLGCSFKTHAQLTLVSYTFDDSTTDPTSVNSSLVSASSITVTGGPMISGYGNSQTIAPDLAIYTKNWPVGTNATDTAKYLEFTVTASPGKTIRLDQFSIYIFSTGPSFFAIGSSFINYNFHIFEASGYPLGNWRHYTLFTSVIVISNGGSTTFRIYAGHSPTSEGELLINSLEIRGTEIIPLPITLTSFDAYNVSEGVKLDWSTASEQNNHYFVIERSEDMRQWQTIDVVAGAGNSQQTLYYSTLDRSVVSGWYYYRLSQVDYDSQSEVFDNQVVPVYVTGPRKVLFPNPASVGEIVHIPPNSHVFDSMGRLLQSGMSTFVPLTSGLYLVGTERLIVK